MVNKIININNPDKVYTVGEVGYYVITVFRLMPKFEEIFFTKGDKDWVVFNGMGKIKLTRESICKAFKCTDFEIID